MKKLGALGVISFGCAILPYIYLIPVYLLSRSMPYGGGSLALYFLALPMFIFIFLEAAALRIGLPELFRKANHEHQAFCSSTFFCLFDRNYFDCISLPEIDSLAANPLLEITPGYTHTEMNKAEEMYQSICKKPLNKCLDL